MFSLPMHTLLSMPTAPAVIPVVALPTRISLCLLVVCVRVPVCGCARVLPRKPYEGFARIVPTQPDHAPVPLQPKLFRARP